MKMKSLRLMPLVVLMSLSTLTFAQSDTQKPMDHSNPQKPAVQSEVQKAFTQMKSLAGTWQGPVTTVPPVAEMGNGKALQVSLRVTSRGNALVHEMSEAGTADDPTRYDHPVTMFYLDSDRLLLTHYCDAGNRPRMTARTSTDGKTVEFDFLDLAGSNQYGHMYHAVFTIIDANHHIEDWTYMMPGDKPMRARLDLQRTTGGSGASGK
jgi:phage tail protein X